MLLELQHVSVSYRDAFGFRAKNHVAIRDLNLVLRPGENIGIMGGNGAGKSTLLKLLAGIYKPTTGKVILHRPCRVSFIGLTAGMVPYLSGVQNIRLIGMLYGIGRREIDRKLDQIVRYSGLQQVIEKPVFTYSTGMKARLAFSVSIHSEPDLMLLDEVMGVGDKAFRERSSESLKHIIQSETSSIIVSHDEAYLRSVCNKILLLEQGSVLEEIEGNERHAGGVTEPGRISNNESYSAGSCR